MRRILVTGGFGFIGSHLIQRLLPDEHVSVHVVDNLVTSPIDVPSFIDGIGRPDRLTYDLRSIEQYSVETPSWDFDEIYHLASVVGPVGVLQHAGKIAQMIVADTYRVLDIAMRCGAKLVDVSTSEVYGGGRDGYCSEGDFKIIQPKPSVRLEYAVSKLASEIAVMNTVRTSSLRAVIVRPFNVAGPRQSGAGGFVVPRFIRQALAGEPLTVYGEGKMIRAFTHVRDIADGLIAAMARGTSGEAYNLGNPANKTSILDLAKRIVHLLDSPSPITFVDPKELFGPLFEEANDKYPDSQKAIEQLNWRPRYGIDEALRDAADYIRAGRSD